MTTRAAEATPPVGLADRIRSHVAVLGDELVAFTRALVEQEAKRHLN